MRVPFCLFVFLAGALSGRTAESKPVPPAALGKIDDPVLPLIIPGYELRVLDRRKPVRFQVGDSQTEAALPIFIYYPTGDRAGALKRVREAYDGLMRLGGKPEWTADELRQVLADLDAALRLLECPPAPAMP